eukprot:c5866_g1_i1.p1 GENE.c5866_g1_i1~~c5866_g1_i1.p1  ORF type:complete len:337 (-),score=48.04 c5866_g1_i1:21-953(-)
MEKLAQALKRVKEVKSDDMPAKIVDNIYLGSVAAAKNIDALREAGVTHILCVSRDIDPRYPSEFIYRSVEVDDLPHEDITRHFEPCFQFIHDCVTNEGKILVHCFAGVSRSVTIVIAYLMAAHRMSLKDAWQVVRRGRKVANPNGGFCMQLKNFEKTSPVWPPGSTEQPPVAVAPPIEEPEPIKPPPPRLSRASSTAQMDFLERTEPRLAFSQTERDPELHREEDEDAEDIPELVKSKTREISQPHLRRRVSSTTTNILPRIRIEQGQPLPSKEIKIMDLLDGVEEFLPRFMQKTKSSLSKQRRGDSFRD